MIASKPKLGLKFLVLLLLSVVVTANAAVVQTNSRSPNTQAGSAASRETVKQKKLPYRGKLAAVDKNAHSFTVGKRTFYMTAETRLSKDSQPARLDQLVIGELVTGSYTRRADGKLLAATVYIGGKKEAAKSK